MTDGQDSIVQIQHSLQHLDQWIEKEDFHGWDPHDALNSPFVRRLTLGNRMIGIAWVQLFKRCPWNLRPLLRVPKKLNPKAVGLFLASYARKFEMTSKVQHLERVVRFADWLSVNSISGYHGACWGYPFDWPNRGFFAPAGTPTIVSSSFIGLGFLDAYRAVNSLGRNGQLMCPIDAGALLRTARSICDFILNDLAVTRPIKDEACYSYTPLDRRFVHNANMMASWLLASVFVETGEPHLGDAARGAARYTARRQRNDGSWPYGEGRADSWVDNFHTGYVLVSLKNIGRYLHTDEFEAATCRGYEFWKERMFLANSVPKYYPDRVFPIDIHCVAQAILTFLEFSDFDPSAMSQADCLCRWAIDNLQDPEGFFHYQIQRWHRARIPYIRWGQAWMQLALTKLIYKSSMTGYPGIALAARS